jgi:acyl-coenzyme A synthetase/AMP-(fatty) acid ligase
LIGELRGDPEATALEEGPTGRRWTYGELRDEVERRAARLRAPAKQLVFCLCRNDAETVFNYLAAVESGHATALVNAGLHQELVRSLVEQYEPDWILRGADWRRGEASPREIHPDLALLLSTSGTTGSPKFVRLAARSVISNAKAIAEALGIGPGDRPIVSLPLHYSYGLSVLNSHLVAGARLLLTEEGVVGRRFWDLVRAGGCTSFAGVPYTYQVLARLDIDSLEVPTLSTMTQAGGKLADDLIALFHAKMARRGGRFFVMYGQTEATARIAILPAHELPRKLGSVGKAIPGGVVAVDAGEVVYRGPNVMMGYAMKGADLGRGDELGGVLRTGDLGRLDDEGFLYILGRAGRDVKLVGLRLNLDEVELMLRHHGPTAVTLSGETLIVHCEWGDDQVFTRPRQELAARLGLAVRLFRFRRVERLPTTSAGKIDYAELKAAG